MYVFMYVCVCECVRIYVKCTHVCMYVCNSSWYVTIYHLLFNYHNIMYEYEIEYEYVYVYVYAYRCTSQYNIWATNSKFGLRKFSSDIRRRYPRAFIVSTKSVCMYVCMYVCVYEYMYQGT